MATVLHEDVQRDPTGEITVEHGLDSYAVIIQVTDNRGDVRPFTVTDSDADTVRLRPSGVAPFKVVVMG